MPIDYCAWNVNIPTVSAVWTWIIGHAFLIGVAFGNRGDGSTKAPGQPVAMVAKSNAEAVADNRRPNPSERAPAKYG